MACYQRVSHPRFNWQKEKNASMVMPYICERDFYIILYLFARTACVVYAMYVQTVQIQNLFQKSGLHEVPPKKEFNNMWYLPFW